MPEFIDDLMLLCHADITSKNPEKYAVYMPNLILCSKTDEVRMRMQSKLQNLSSDYNEIRNRTLQYHREIKYENTILTAK